MLSLGSFKTGAILLVSMFVPLITIYGAKTIFALTLITYFS